MNKLFGCLLFSLSLGVNAYPLNTYVLSGHVLGDASSASAADQLLHVGVGDYFELFLDVQKLDFNSYQVGVRGLIGNQGLPLTAGDGFYYGNDGGLSGLGVNCWGFPLLPSESGGELYPDQLGIALRGQELLYAGMPIPDDMRLVDANGAIRVENFLEGFISLGFSSLDGEFLLRGTIDGIDAHAVPEAGIGYFGLIALALLIYVRTARRSPSFTLR